MKDNIDQEYTKALTEAEEEGEIPPQQREKEPIEGVEGEEGDVEKQARKFSEIKERVFP